MRSELVIKTLLLGLLALVLLALHFCTPKPLEVEACEYSKTVCLPPSTLGSTCTPLTLPPGRWVNGKCLRPTVAIPERTIQ